MVISVSVLSANVSEHLSQCLSPHSSESLSLQLNVMKAFSKVNVGTDRKNLAAPSLALGS